MPGGKLQKKPSKGKSQPKRKNPRQRPPRGAYGSGQSTSPWRDQPIGSPGEMAFAPVAKGRRQTMKPPQMQSLRNGDCVVKHREYIQDIVAGSGTPSVFAASTFAVNPGQVATFPWLSQVAKNFESYLFRKLRFCYETEAPSSLGGSAVVTIDYDAMDAAPLTKQQAMAYRGAVRSPPWEPCCHSSVKEDLSKQKSYFVRPGALPAGGDIKMYDTGNLFVCTQNVTTASAVCGELYVEYEVELLTPIWENLSGTSGVLYAPGTAGQAAAALFGTSPLVGQGQIQLSTPNPGANVVSVSGLVVGQEYSVNLLIDGTVLAQTNAVSSSTAMTVKNGASGVNAAATQFAEVSTWTATATSGTITLTGSATTVTAAGLIISLIPTQAL